jgi:hypothetical protein
MTVGHASDRRRLDRERLRVQWPPQRVSGFLSGGALLLALHCLPGRLPLRPC